MTRNKKKLRRVERRSRLAAATRALVLTGLLLSGTAGTAGALTIELNTAPVWNVVNSLLSLLSPADVQLTGGGLNSTVSTVGNYLGGLIGTVTVNGAPGATTLVINSNIGTTDGLFSDGLVTVGGGSAANTGTLKINVGNTLTAGGLTNINAFGLLDVAGTLAAKNNVTVGNNGTLTLRTGASLNLDAGKNLLLNGGSLLFKTADGLSTADGILANTYLLNNGTILGAKLGFAGFTNSVNIAGNGGGLNVTADLLDLAGLDLNLGTATAQPTTVTIKGALPGQTIPEFLGGNVTVRGNAAAQTLQLGVPGYTGNSNSAYNITLLGGNGVLAAADKALLNVDYGKFSVANLTVGAATGLYAGTVTVNNSGSLTATNTMSINGGLGQAGTVKFGPVGGSANIVKAKNLVVGGLTSYGVLDMASNAGKVIVDTAAGGGLTVGLNGQVNLNNAGSVLEFTGDWTVGQADLAAGGAAANGKIWLNNGALNVDGTLNVNGNLSTQLGGNTVLGTTTTVGALNTGVGTLTLNAGKGMNVLGLNNGGLISGTVKVVGTGSAADTLTVGQNGVSMTAGSTTQGSVQLQGSAAARAGLAVTGNGAANSVYQMQSILAGGENGLGASATSGNIRVDNATLKVGSLGLRGMAADAATLTIGGTAAANVTVGALTVGNATDKGSVTVTAGSLTADTLNYTAGNGNIFVDSAGLLNLTGDATLAGNSLTHAASLQAGKVALNNTTMNVGGALNLTSAGPDIGVDVTGSTINTKTLTAKNGAADVGLSWNGGNINIYGNGGAFASATQVNVTGGNMTLGGADLNVGGTTLTTQGGSYGGPVNVSGGKLNVSTGTWTLGNTAGGVTVTAADGLNVTGGTLNVGKLTTTGAGTVNVGTGPGIGKLALTGGNGSLATTTGSVNVDINGVFQAALDAVANGTALQNGVGQFDVGLGGTLLLTGTGTITLAQLQALTQNLINGAGALQLQGITVVDVDPTTTLVGVLGTSVPNAVVVAKDGDNVNQSTTVKGLTGLGVADITIQASNGEFRLVGDSVNKNFQLSANGGFDTDIVVGQNGLLTFGNAAGTSPTYGTLQGDITLDGKLNAVNGTFTLDGDVNGTANAQGVNVASATLNVQKLDLSASPNSVVTVTGNGSLLAAVTSYVQAVNLDSGTLATINGADLTINGNASLINGSTLRSDHDLTFTGTTLTTENSTIQVANTFDATGKDINGVALTMNVGGTLKADDVSGDSGSQYQLGALTATGNVGLNNNSTMNVTGAMTANGATTVNNGSSLTVGGPLSTAGLTADNGAVVTATSGAAVNGALSLGPTAKADMTVGGDLTGVTTATLNNGSTLGVSGAMTASGLTSLDNGSKLKTGGTLTTAGLTVDNGALVQALADAVINGALSVGPTAKADMTVGTNLTGVTTATLNNGSTLGVSGAMTTSGLTDVEKGSALTVGGLLTAGGLKADTAATVQAGSAQINGTLDLGATAAAQMTVTGALTATGAASVNNGSSLTVGSPLTVNGLTVDNGATVTANGDASTGALSVGPTAQSTMTVGGNLNSTTAALDHGSTLDVTGTMTASGLTTVNDAATLKVGDALSTVGLTADNGAVITATKNATTGALNLGQTTAATMTVGGDLNSDAATLNHGSTLDVTGAMIASGLTTLDMASKLTVDGALTTNGLTADNGAVVTATKDASTGALSLGPTAKADMTVGGTLDSTTAALDHGSTLNVSGAMTATGATTLNNTAALTVGGVLTTNGLTADNGAVVTATKDASTGALSLGPTAKADMTVGGKLDSSTVDLNNGSTLNVSGAMTATGATTLNNTAALTVGGVLTTNGLTADNGAVVTATTDASTGALSLGPTAKADMTVGGNLTTTTASLNNGSTLGVTGTMTATDAVSVDNAAALTANILNLQGGGGTTAALTVGDTAAATVTTHTLNVGSATEKGTVSVKNGTLTTDVLNNDAANGGVFVDNAGTLNVTGGLALAGDSLVSATAVQAGKFALNTTGTLNVGGALNLTGTGPAVTVGLTGGNINAQTLAVTNGGAPTALNWNGGNLTLYGNGGAFSSATQMNVAGGNMTLGGPDLNVGGTTLTTQGGSYGGPVNVSGTGKLNVAMGNWTLTDTGGGLNVAAANGLNVTGGVLTTAKLTVTGAGSAVIGGGVGIGKLLLTGGNGSLASTANSININKNGVFQSAYGTAANGLNTQTGVGQFNTAAGGTLVLTGLNTITLADLKTLTANMITGQGSLQLQGTTITGVDSNTTLNDVLGLSLPDHVVVASDGDVVNTSTTVKGVTTATPGASDITLIVDPGEFRLVGDSTDPNFQLGQNGDKLTNIDVKDNGILTLGNAAGTSPTYGTLNGNIALDGELNAVNGTFTVGDVIGGPNADGVTVIGATLNTGTLDLSASPTSTVNVNSGGTLLAGKDSTVWAVNLDNGTFGTAPGADLTINGPTSLTNGSKLQAGDDLNFTAPGATLTADHSSITVGGTFDATGKNISGDALAITVGGELKTADLSGDNGSQYQAGKLTATGDVLLDNGSTLLVSGPDGATIGGTLTMDHNAAAQIVGAATIGGDTTLDNGAKLQIGKDAAINGALDLGKTAAAQMTVGGDLTGVTSVTLNNGSALGVTGDLTNTGATTLDKNSMASVGGTLTTTEVTLDNGAKLQVGKDAVLNGALNLGQTGAAQMSVGGDLTGVTSATVTNGSALGVTGDLTNAGATTLDKNSTASVGGTLTSGPVTLDSGAKLQVGKDAMVNGVLEIGKTGASQMGVGGNLSGVTAAAVTNGSTLGVVGNLTNAGVTIVDKNSTVSVGGTLTGGPVTLDSGAKVQVGKDAVVNGALDIGKTGASQMGVGGNLSGVTDVTLGNGSTLGVVGNLTNTGTTILDKGSTASVGGTFTPGGAVSVLDGSTLNTGTMVTSSGTTVAVGGASGQGGSLNIGTLNSASGGIFTVDPVNGTSFMGVNALTDKKLQATVVVGNNGILSLGSQDKQWVLNQTAAARSSADSVLALRTPVTLEGRGQILVGEQYQKTPGMEGVWANNPTADKYSLALRGKSLLIADLDAVSGGGALLTVGAGSTTDKNVLVETSAGVRLYKNSGLKGGTTITLVDGLGAGSVLQEQGGTALTDGQALVLNGGLSTNSRLVSVNAITFNQSKGALEAGTRTEKATNVLPGLSDELGTIIDKASSRGLDVNHDNAGIRFISRAADTRYISDAGEAARVLEGAARLSAAGAVQGMTRSISDAAVAAAEARTASDSMLRNSNQVSSLHRSEDGSWQSDTGLGSGDANRTGLGLWIMPLYQSENVWGMKADNFHTGYNGGFGGVALGADYTFEDMLRFGVAFNIGGGYAQSSGDFNTTTNNFNFWGVSLYGNWTRNNFGLNADVGYTGNYNKVKQELPSGMQMKDLNADITSSAITTGLRAEYRIETSIMNIIPHAGVRYMNLVTDSYDAKSGGTVFSADRTDQNIWTFPVGVSFDKTWQSESGWKFTPRLDATLLPATGDVKAHNNVRVPGLDASADLKTQVVDYLTFQGGVGFDVQKDNIAFGIGYTIQASEHRTAHGVFGTLRYEF